MARTVPGLAQNALMQRTHFVYLAVMLDEVKKLDPRFRKMDFRFTSEIPRFWSAGDPVRTHFANAFSVLLPEFERLFISTLAPRLREVKDPAQQAQGRIFCAQEGQHAAFHRNYNQWLVSLGYSATPWIERTLKRSLHLMAKHSPKSWLLALTSGGEHITSFMANDYLAHPEKWSHGSDNAVSDLWKWHAAEEIEHKAVCFDVYQSLEGNTTIRRLAFLIILFQTLIFSSMVQLYLLWSDGLLFKRNTWSGQYRLLLSADGFLIGVLREARKYLRKDFHPWQTRDAHLVQSWEKEYLKGKVHAVI